MDSKTLNKITESLRTIYTSNGEDIFYDPGLLQLVMSDFVPECKKEINLLLQVLKVPNLLSYIQEIAKPPEAHRTEKIENLKNKLTSELFITSEAAAFSIYCYVSALGDETILAQSKAVLDLKKQITPASENNHWPLPLNLLNSERSYPLGILEVIKQNKNSNQNDLSLVIGQDTNGNYVSVDLTRCGNILLGGSTGSGKTVCLNTIITNLLFYKSPDDVKLLLIDIKGIDLVYWNNIPHLLTPVITDPRIADSVLSWLEAELSRRYALFSESACRNIDDFNRIAKEKLPRIVVIVDEYAELYLVARSTTEWLIKKASVAGIHLIISTQRPSSEIISNDAKNNITMRFAFSMSSSLDSRLILNDPGARQLRTNGDMILADFNEQTMTRMQCAMAADAEIRNIVQWFDNNNMHPFYMETKNPYETFQIETSKTNSEDNQVDELFEEAVRQVLNTGTASASMLQRRFRIGFTRAGRLIDLMEDLGIIGEARGEKSREVIMSRQEVEERFFDHGDGCPPCAVQADTTKTTAPVQKEPHNENIWAKRLALAKENRVAGRVSDKPVQQQSVDNASVDLATEEAQPDSESHSFSWIKEIFLGFFK